MLYTITTFSQYSQSSRVFPYTVLSGLKWEHVEQHLHNAGIVRTDFIPTRLDPNSKEYSGAYSYRNQYHEYCRVTVN